MDIIVSCTGFEKGYDTPEPELWEELGLQYDPTSFLRWSLLDEKAEEQSVNCYHTSRPLPYNMVIPLRITERNRFQTPSTAALLSLTSQLGMVGVLFSQDTSTQPPHH